MSYDPELPKWPDGGTPEWWGRPEHTWVVSGLRDRVKQLRELETRAAESKLTAELAAAEAERCKEAAQTLRDELDDKLQELDLEERDIHFKPHTLLLRLELKADEYDPEEIITRIKEARGASYGTGPSETRGIILTVVTDPSVGEWRAGLVVEMPDGEVCLIGSTSDKFRVGNKDPERRPFPKI
jgi:hypothetical protein